MIHFVEKRLVFYSISFVTGIASLLAFLFLPLNFWIDMTGGMHIEFSSQVLPDAESLRTQVENFQNTYTFEGALPVSTGIFYEVSGSDVFVVDLGLKALSDLSKKKREELESTLPNILEHELQVSFPDAGIIKVSHNRIGPSLSEYIRDTAILTLFLVIIGITLYVAWAFRGSLRELSSFSFWIITVITLFHDVLLTIGAYLVASFFFPEFKIDTLFITAVLTILGYSINDTIVVLDRIRSNIQDITKKAFEFPAVINTAVTATLTRSLYTSLTLILVLVALFFFGPESIRGFVLTLIFGSVIGTYSSIFVAAPLLYDFNGQKKVIQKIPEAPKPEESGLEEESIPPSYF